MNTPLREVVADALPEPALVFDSLNHSCAFGKGVCIESRFADFYSADQMREYARAALTAALAAGKGEAGSAPMTC